MKKILTLLVMFLATASILTAQTPNLNYQMIVRNQTSSDVTVGEKLFHQNDLIYSTSVTVNVYILSAMEVDANYSQVYDTTITSTTNKNGMLTITLKDKMVNGVSKFSTINWKDAKIVVKNDNLGIQDTMDILPVPYAYNVYTDSSITTKRIVDYIDKSHKDAVTATFSAAHNNEPYMNAMRDTIASVLRHNPDMVKSLAIEFLAKVDTTDVRKANANINAETKAFVVDTIVDYVKNHRPGAYDILGEYLQTATVADVERLIDAAESNTENLDAIIEMIADSIIDYMTEHKEAVKNLVKDFVDNHTLTPDQIDQIQNVVKTENPGAYNAAKTILDSLILDYLVKNDYASGVCGDNIITVCDLQNQINAIASSNFAICPTFGTTKIGGNSDQFIFSTPINSNNGNVNLADGTYSYEITFPNSNYPKLTLQAQYKHENGTDSIISSPMNTGDNVNRIFNVTPKMKVACMDTATFGTAAQHACEVSCECPDIATFTKTTDSRSDLMDNHGILLTATLTNDYYGDDATCGFQYRYKNETEWHNLSEVLGQTPVVKNGLTFTDTLKMNFCGDTLVVRPYVFCGGDTNYGQYTPGATVTLREFKLFITPENPHLTNNSVEVSVKNGIHISTQSLIDEFNTEWPSVEDIVDHYGNSYGVNPQINYRWTGTGFDQQGTSVNIGSTGEYTVKCTISGIFNSSASCVIEKKFTVVQ